MRVYHKIDRHSATIMRSHGLSVGRFDVLNHAGIHKGCTQQELAEAMFVTKGNITQLLDGMEADGLLYRRRRGRTNLIYLTEAGETLRASALTDQLENIEESMSALTSEEQSTLQALLRKIDHSLKDTTS